jgi:hypothetical protein
VPEQHVQADVDAGLVHDRHVDREVLGTQDRAIDQASRHLGVLGEPLLELAVERRHARGQDDRPVGRQREQGRDALVAGS